MLFKTFKNERKIGAKERKPADEPMNPSTVV